jgi:hypothetical protein
MTSGQRVRRRATRAASIPGWYPPKAKKQANPTRMVFFLQVRLFAGL